MNTLDLKPFLEKQKELDERINTEHHVTHQSTKVERFLALLVEVGELANATRAFKYWSLKKAEPRGILLDEYADGLHFFLSLALVFGYGLGTVNYPTLVEAKNTQVQAFAETYDAIITFMRSEVEDDYRRALNLFLSLGSALSFTPEDIKEGYLLKLVVNYTRQNTKY